jgi:hypothetical protein
MIARRPLFQFGRTSTRLPPHLAQIRRWNDKTDEAARRGSLVLLSDADRVI